MKTLDIVANMKKAARDADTVSIGGGLFCPVELFEAANQLEAVPELVAALNEMISLTEKLTLVPDVDVFMGFVDALGKSRDAIAKAEGMQ